VLFILGQKWLVGQTEEQLKALVEFKSEVFLLKALGR
jgi:hypothetical protein